MKTAYGTAGASNFSARAVLMWMAMAIKSEDFTAILRINVSALYYFDDGRGLTVCFICDSLDSVAAIKAWFPKVINKFKAGYAECGVNLFNLTAATEIPKNEQ